MGEAVTTPSLPSRPPPTSCPSTPSPSLHPIHLLPPLPLSLLLPLPLSPTVWHCRQAGGFIWWGWATSKNTKMPFLWNVCKVTQQCRWMLSWAGKRDQESPTGKKSGGQREATEEWLLYATLIANIYLCSHANVVLIKDTCIPYAAFLFYTFHLKVSDKFCIFLNVILVLVFVHQRFVQWLVFYL